MLKKISSHRDFKKVKAKVGRKVAKTGAGNKSIKVSTKKLQLATQLKEGEATMQTIVSKLTHYSGVARLTALQELRHMVAKLPSVDEYVSILMPPSLENLFDEEVDTRTCVLDFYQTLFAVCTPTSFTSVMPVIVTYLGSGLTNLSRAIRATTLQFLLIIVNTHPSLLIPYHSKLTEYLLLMLKDTTQLGSIINNYKREAAKKNEGQSKPKTSDAKAKLTFLSCILQILQAFFRVLRSSSESQRVSSAVSIAYDPASAHNCVILLRYFASNPSASITLAVDKPRSLPTSIPEDSVHSLCIFLANHWSGLTLTDSIVSNESIAVLIDITALALHMTPVLAEDSSSAYSTFLHTAWKHFPYTSTESAVAVPNSAIDKSSRFLAQSLNISLCELVLQLYESSARGEFDQANQYLSDILLAFASGTDSTMPVSQIERAVRALGVILSKSNVRADAAVSPQSLATLRLFHQILSHTSQSKEHALIFVALYSCTCDFLLSYRSMSGDLETSGVYLQLALILGTFPSSMHLLPNDSGYYTDRVLATYLSLLKQFPCPQETSICEVITSFALHFTSIASFDLLSDSAKTSLLDISFHAPVDAYKAMLPCISTALCQAPEAVTLHGYFFTILYSRRQDIGVDDFFECCFEFLRQFACALSRLPLEQLASVLSTQRTVETIAQTLIRCSSSVSPARILRAVLPYAEELSTLAVDPSGELKPKASLLTAALLLSVLVALLQAAQHDPDLSSSATPVLDVALTLSMYLSFTTVSSRSMKSLEEYFGDKVAQIILSLVVQALQMPSLFPRYLVESMRRAEENAALASEGLRRIDSLLELDLNWSLIKAHHGSVAEAVSLLVEKSRGECDPSVLRRIQETLARYS